MSFATTLATLLLISALSQHVRLYSKTRMSYSVKDLVYLRPKPCEVAAEKFLTESETARASYVGTWYRHIILSPPQRNLSQPLAACSPQALQSTDKSIDAKFQLQHTTEHHT
eukprot:scaffold13221_cov123-Skeletonema_dohrnii-CCMP3373.AAC.4